MGASKRLAEIVTQSLQSQSKTKFITVRFGNVLGSSGSVIPLFKNQIENGGPVTVTHPKITRYFMLIEEAAMLVLESSVLGNSGEILHLDMGEPIRILDLAKDMIRLSGFDQNEIKIKFTGLRNGEKIYEELLSDEEKTFETSNDKIRIAESIHKIKHWKVIQGSFEDIPNQNATWYVDPPYQFGGEYYRESNKKIDFEKLGKWCESRKGQVIVCENTKADWMDFKPMIQFTGSVHTTTEAIWSNLPTAFDHEQLTMF